MRVIADEQLSGASREAVQTRLELCSRLHIERLLGPLFALAAAEDITGIARAVAYQIIEALACSSAEGRRGGQRPRSGRTRPAAQIRRPLRRLPSPSAALLKPAPRSLAAQLWLLKNGTPDDKGPRRTAAACFERPHLDSRRQGHAEAALPHHRYRVCGERAIRVDILERLPSDPSGDVLARRLERDAAAGRVQRLWLTVTGAMTSLTGASR